jgi:hypothetical protein
VVWLLCWLEQLGIGEVGVLVCRGVAASVQRSRQVRQLVRHGPGEVGPQVGEAAHARQAGAAPVLVACWALELVWPGAHGEVELQVQEGEAAALQGAQQKRKCWEVSWLVTASVQGAGW